MTEQQADYNIKSKTIFRTVKNEDHPFVMIDRRPVENPALSWGAKGVLSYLLSRPDNWTVRLRDLVNRSTDGVYKIRGYLKELNKAGHLLRKEERDPITKRITQYTLEIYELPFTTKPLTNLPLAVNLTLNDTEVNDKKSKKIKEGASAAKPPTPEEVKLFREVTERYPSKVNYDDVVLSIQKASRRLGHPATKDDLLPFYRKWCWKAYNKIGLGWLEWAESGIVPQNGTWKPSNPNYNNNMAILQAFAEKG